MNLGMVYEKHPRVALRSIKDLVSKLGFTFEEGKFPLIWVRETEEGAEILSLVPGVLNPSAFLNQPCVLSVASKKRFLPLEAQLKKDSLKIEQPLALYQGSELLEVHLSFEILTLKGSKTGPFKGVDQVLYLMKNQETFYLDQRAIKQLYFNLGLPNQKLDNLGSFWFQEGFVSQLEKASFKKIA